MAEGAVVDAGSAMPASGEGAGGAVPSAPELGTLWQAEELKGSKSLARYKTVDDLGKAYVDMERKLGERTGVSIPKEDATPEQWQAYYQQLPGYPKDPKNYGVTPPELPPEAGAWHPEFVQTFLQDVAHKEGMTTRQVQAVFNYYAQFIANQVQTQRDEDAQQINTVYEDLRRDWTVNVDRNMAVANLYLEREHGQDAWWETIITKQDGKSVPLKNLPGFIRMAHELGVMRGYDRFVQGNGTSGLLTRELASQRLDEAYARRSRGEITAQELNTAIEQYQPIISGIGR